MANQPSLEDDRSAPSVRVLLVDDYEPFRRFLRSKLETTSQFQIVGEASDGLEAVQKAEMLHPDLVVLDLGLSNLNGVEVVRRLRSLCPKCKILVASQQCDDDVVQEVLSLGALGYVVKADGGSELLAAVDTVLHGRQFVSRRLSGDTLTLPADSQVPDR